MRNIINLSDLWQKEETKGVFSSFDLPHKTPADKAPKTLTLRRKLYISEEDKSEEFFLEIKGLCGFVTAFIGNNEVKKENCFIAPRYIDLTPFIKKGAESEIRLEITPEADPNGDFTFFGAQVLCVARSHFNVTVNNDPISAETEFINGGVKLTLRADIINPNNYDVVIFKLISPDGESSEVKTARPTEGFQEFFIESPLRWDGVHSDYKYKAEITLQRDSEIIDGVSKDFGIREFKAEKDGFFKLNGIKLPLNGCALRSLESIEKDAEGLRELDANLVLLNFIDPEEKVLNICDKLGLMVFFLFPKTGSFDELKRVTKILSSHPSAAFIGYDSFDPAYGKKFCAEVKGCTKDIYTAGTSNILNGESLNDAIPDVLLISEKAPAEKSGFGTTENRYNEIISNHPYYRFAVFADITAPENGEQDYFSVCHERMWSIFGTKKNTVCYFTGFFTDKTNSGDRTGLITDGGKTKKDAFWFYKAQFSAEKFIKIASLPKTAAKKKISVKCYTNSSFPVLSLNGKTKKRLRPVKLSPGVYIFENVRLKRKENSLVLLSGDKSDGTRIYRGKIKTQ